MSITNPSALRGTQASLKMLKELEVLWHVGKLCFHTSRLNSFLKFLGQSSFLKKIKGLLAESRDF